MARMARQLCIRANAHTHCLDGVFPVSTTKQMIVHISSCRSRGSRMLLFTFIHWLQPPGISRLVAAPLYSQESSCGWIIWHVIDGPCRSITFTDVWRIGAAGLDSFPMVDHSGRDRGVGACFAKHLGPASHPHGIEPACCSLCASGPAYRTILFSAWLL